MNFLIWICFLILCTFSEPCLYSEINTHICNICYRQPQIQYQIIQCSINSEPNNQYSLQQCLARCCIDTDSSQLYNILECSHKKISQTTDQENSENVTIIIAVVVSVFGVCLIIVIVSLIKRNRCFCSCSGNLGDCLKFCGYLLTCGCITEKFQKKEEQRPQIIIHPPEKNPQSDTRMLPVPETKPKQSYHLKWKKVGKPFIPPQKQQCSICLFEKTNCVTQCGHLYHLGCLWQWLSRNQHCPNCVSENVLPVSYYCLKCKKKYAQFDMIKNSKKIENFNKFIEYRLEFCEKCR